MSFSKSFTNQIARELAKDAYKGSKSQKSNIRQYFYDEDNAENYIIESDAANVTNFILFGIFCWCFLYIGSIITLSVGIFRLLKKRVPLKITRDVPVYKYDGRYKDDKKFIGYETISSKLKETSDNLENTEGFEEIIKKSKRANIIYIILGGVFLFVYFLLTLI